MPGLVLGLFVLFVWCCAKSSGLAQPAGNLQIAVAAVFSGPNIPSAMKDGYQIRDEEAIHFLTFSIVDWVDVFSRRSHRDTLIESLNFCVANKGALVYGFVIMTNHMHIILQSAQGRLSGLIRDFKKFTSVKLLEAIRHEPESRREWMLHRFAWNAQQRSTVTNYQIWTHDNHPVELRSDKFFRQRLQYIHQNPVRAGWVTAAEDYLYSSAGWFEGRPGLVPITLWRDFG